MDKKSAAKVQKKFEYTNVLLDKREGGRDFFVIPNLCHEHPVVQTKMKILHTQLFVFFYISCFQASLSMRYKKTSPIGLVLHFGLRRERDSNPRSLSAQRFSRPPQSTTLPSLLQNRLQKYCFFLNCANFYALFLRISIFYSNFAPKIVQKCCYKYSNPRYTA